MFFVSILPVCYLAFVVIQLFADTSLTVATVHQLLISDDDQLDVVVCVRVSERPYVCMCLLVTDDM